jgi:hypothetical protein
MNFEPCLFSVAKRVPPGSSPRFVSWRNSGYPPGCNTDSPRSHHPQVLPGRGAWHSDLPNPSPQEVPRPSRLAQEFEIIATGVVSGSESPRAAPSIRERREGPARTPASVGWPTDPVSTRGRFLGVQFAIPEWLERPAFASAGASSNQAGTAGMASDAAPLSADSATVAIPWGGPLSRGFMAGIAGAIIRTY